MNQFLSFLGVFIFIFVFESVGSNSYLLDNVRDIESVNSDLTLRIDPNSVEFSSQGGSFQVSIESEAEAYFIENTPFWLSVEKENGYFILSASANSYSEIRSVILKVVNGGNTVELPVVQQSKMSEYHQRKQLAEVVKIIEAEPIFVGINDTIPLTLAKDSLSFPADGGVDIIQITTPDPFYLVSGFPDWVKVQTTNTTIEIACEANPDKKPRKQKFYIVTYDEKKPLFVEQEAASVQATMLSETTKSSKSVEIPEPTEDGEENMFDEQERKAIEKAISEGMKRQKKEQEALLKQEEKRQKELQRILDDEKIRKERKTEAQMKLEEKERKAAEKASAKEMKQKQKEQEALLKQEEKRQKELQQIMEEEKIRQERLAEDQKRLEEKERKAVEKSISEGMKRQRKEKEERLKQEEKRQKELQQIMEEEKIRQERLAEDQKRLEEKERKAAEKASAKEMKQKQKEQEALLKQEEKRQKELQKALEAEKAKHEKEAQEQKKLKEQDRKTKEKAVSEKEKRKEKEEDQQEKKQKETKKKQKSKESRELGERKIFEQKKRETED